MAPLSNRDRSGRQKEPVCPRVFNIIAGRSDPAFCHYCNKNKPDPGDKYRLPNGIDVCKDCAARYGAGTAKRAARKAKAVKG